MSESNQTGAARRVRIALGQINTSVGDIRANVDTMIDYIERAREAECDIVVFPELAVSGYPPEDLLFKPRFIKDCRTGLDHLIKNSAGLIVLAGFPEERDSRLYNAAAIINDGRLAGTYHKTELPNYGVFDERRYFTEGKHHCRVNVDGITFSVTICEDIWQLDHVVARELCESDVALNINLSASPFHSGKKEERLKILNRFSSEACSLLCYCNLVGGQDEIVFDGGSVVIDAAGNTIAQAARFVEELLIVDLEVSAVSCSAGESSRPGSKIFSIDLEARLKGDRRSKIEPSLAELETDRLDEIYQATLLGLRDYLRKNHFKKAVVGLSGGIDSALVVVLAVHALGAENVAAVTMPSKFSSEATFTDAKRIAEILGIPCYEVPIKELHENYLETLAVPLEYGTPGIESENIQARIRGNILMAFSNRFGWLVLTTGNKSETAVGYSTLYGDTAGGFAVIKDLYKTRVYELSRWINEKFGQELIPVSVIDRVPSAELKEDQSDQDSLPPYDDLDRILIEYIERHRSLDEIVEETGYDPEVLKDIIRRVEISEYKRRQSPPGIKITPVAFGRDRRMPISNRYHSDLF